MKNTKGYTLIELLVVMSIFIVVIIITGESFNTILKHSYKLFSSEESNIEGMIGLEMLRHDINQAGYGLFTETSPVAYSEAPGAPANAYNDAGTNVPRPILAGSIASGLSDTGAEAGASSTYNLLAGTDYLVVKAASVGSSKASQRWSYLNFSSRVVSPHVWVSGAENIVGGGTSADRVVLLRRTTSPPNPITLVPDPANDIYYAYSDVAFSHLSSQSASVMSIYGIVGGPTTPRMPFNRTDYFVAVPATASKLSPNCAPNTGILYKTVMNHADGKLNYTPLLDCVADMQVVLGWDMDGDGAVDSYTNEAGNVCNGLCTSPANGQTAVNALSTANNSSVSLTPSIRNNLKLVKVYVLAQNGRRDSSYVSSDPEVCDPGENALTRPSSAGKYTLAATMKNYRWKLYRIIVRPKNLPSNQ